MLFGKKGKEKRKEETPDEILKDNFEESLEYSTENPVKKSEKKKHRIKRFLICISLAVLFAFGVFLYFFMKNGSVPLGRAENGAEQISGTVPEKIAYSYQIQESFGIPQDWQDGVKELNGNVPFFSAEDVEACQKYGSFQYYAPLDSFGRCVVACANIGPDLLPTEERGAIGNVRPSGWHLEKYDCVEGNYLYNRCHLIAYMLTGQNANECNLITGTRQLNVDRERGMLPYEEKVNSYIKETGNHVLYRVIPRFEGENLLADGITMEAYSIEDSGKGVCFCVFVPNTQEGITINYADGSSRQ